MNNTNTKKIQIPFAIQLDESTDVANLSQILVYIRYVAYLMRISRKIFYFVAFWELLSKLSMYYKLFLIFF